MPDIESNYLIGSLSAIATALTTLGFALRNHLKKEKVSDASDSSTIKGFQSNDKVLDNLVAEVARLTARLNEVEAKVDHLTDKLAAIRLIALDCYQLARDA